jgi:hypothetical protein
MRHLEASDLLRQGACDHLFEVVSGLDFAVPGGTKSGQTIASLWLEEYPKDAFIESCGRIGRRWRCVVSDQQIHPHGIQNQNDPEYCRRCGCMRVAVADDRPLGNGRQFPAEELTESGHVTPRGHFHPGRCGFPAEMDAGHGMAWNIQPGPPNTPADPKMPFEREPELYFTPEPTANGRSEQGKKKYESIENNDDGSLDSALGRGPGAECTGGRIG